MRAVNITGGRAVLCKLVLALGGLELAAGCAVVDEPRGSSRRVDVIYLETSRRVWLTPEEREHAACLDGQWLVCDALLGRFSLRRCHCPSEGSVR